MKCIACNSTALVEGKVKAVHEIKFEPKDLPLLKKIFMGDRPIRAYGCVHCGHLQLAIEFTDEDKEKYQQFEGQQPDLLERLHSKK